MDISTQIRSTAVEAKRYLKSALKESPEVPGAARDEFQKSDSLSEAFERIPSPVSKVKARLLSDNFEAWNQRWKLIESADTDINSTYYTWDNDVFGRALLGHIFHKARQGVNVRMMVDAVGDPVGKRGMKAKWGGQDYLQELVALPNAEARVYHPHYKKPFSAILHPTGLEGIAANHDKILEVDGEAAITGGRNIGHHYYIHPNDEPTAWRDVDLMLEGQGAALELRQAIEDEYSLALLHHSVKPDLFGNWKRRDLELLGDYALMDLWLKGQGASDAPSLVAQALSCLPGLGVSREPNQREREHLLKSAEELVHNQELRGSYKQPSSPQHEVEAKVIDRVSAANPKGIDEMNATFLALAQNATREIDIQSPYFVLTDPILDAMKEASDRGVKIRVATNTPSSSDSFFTQVFLLNDWKKILATIPNLELYGATGERKHHGKVAVFDDQVSIVGTYNLDLISGHANGEVAAVIDSPEFAAELSDSIVADYADATIGYQQYKIAWNSEGQPIDLHGRSVLDVQGRLIGEPLAVFGPENHCTPDQLQPYDKRIKRWNWMRRHLPQLKSLRRNEGQ